jgi:phytoene dehydrogenase-like protein
MVGVFPMNQTHWTPTRLYPSYRHMRRWVVFRWVSDGPGRAREQRMDLDGSWHDMAAVWHPRPKDRWRVMELGRVGDETGPRSLHATVTAENLREQRELEKAAAKITRDLMVAHPQITERQAAGAAAFALAPFDLPSVQEMLAGVFPERSALVVLADPESDDDGA